MTYCVLGSTPTKVYFIIEDTKLFNISENVLSEIFYDNRFKYKKYSEILYSEFNLIITLSFSYGETFIFNYLKYLKLGKNIKLNKLTRKYFE
jgi:hypothetical protein